MHTLSVVPRHRYRICSGQVGFNVGFQKWHDLCDVGGCAVAPTQCCIEARSAWTSPNLKQTLALDACVWKSRCSTNCDVTRRHSIYDDIATSSMVCGTADRNIMSSHFVRCGARHVEQSIMCRCSNPPLRWRAQLQRHAYLDMQSWQSWHPSMLHPQTTCVD
jgi:hypothetical protein